MLLESSILNLTTCVGVLCVIVIYFKYSFNYWARMGVPQIPPSFPFGNMGSVFMLRQNMGEKIKEIYDTVKPLGYKYIGLYFFTRKAFLATSPELVKNILTKDFQYFDDRGIHYDEVNDPLSAHLFSLSGSKWKNLRAKFTPTFTSGKLKYMFQTLLECGNQMITTLFEISDKGENVEMKDIMARFTTDVIGSCAFGLECNSMKHPKNEFREMGKRAFTQTVGDVIKVTIIRAFPNLAALLGLGIFSPSVTEFFKHVVEETVAYRETNNVTRKDFMQLLIQLKNNGQVDGDNHTTNDPVKPLEGTNLTLNQAAAQAFIFFIAGFETTATTMTFALFEMSLNPDFQERARYDVMKAIKEHDDQLNYNAIMEMHYLDKIVAETLRKYPPAPVYLRKCTKDYHIPDTNVVIRKGLSVLIPALGLQRDPEYFPNPDEFDPERFNSENKSKIQDYTYIPFGEGPRACIGQRFALIQVKVGLALILKNFAFTLVPQTTLPLKMESKGIIITPLGGIWLKLQSIR